MSQLALALEAQVSARHISFLETGRASPSADMITRLGDALHLPLAARNQMLNQAGFAARYPGRQWHAEEMAPIRSAITHMLDRHSPYPAFAMDSVWTILQMNACAQKLFGALGAKTGNSILDLMTSDTLPALIDNWPQVAHHAVQRLRTESAAQGGVEILEQVAQKLAQVPLPENQTIGPVVPAIYRMGETKLSLFSTIAQFGTPEDLTLADLKIELFFPADSATRNALTRLMASAVDSPPHDDCPNDADWTSLWPSSRA